MRQHIAYMLPLLGLLVSMALPVLAQDAPDKIYLAADHVSHDPDSGTYTAIGNVELAYGQRVLTADKVIYNDQKNLALAQGNVVMLSDNGDVFFAPHARLSRNFNQGVVDNLGAVFADQSKLTARRGRLEKNRRILDNVTYSPCEICRSESVLKQRPLWQIRARKVIQDLKSQDIIYHHAFFDLYGVPIFYLPYLSHPDPKVKRRSGLLIPSIEQSTIFGTAFKIPYYQTLGPHHDLLIEPIITTNQGTIMHLKGRSRLQDGWIDIDGSVTKGDLDGKPNHLRGHVKANGRYILNRHLRLNLDAERSTDDTYLRRYQFGGGDTLISRLELEGLNDRNYLRSNIILFQDQRSYVRQRHVGQVLPSFLYDFHSKPSWLNSVWNYTSDFGALLRRSGTDTVRWSNAIGWTLPYTSENGHVLKLEAQGRVDLYRVADGPENFPALPPLWNTTQSPSNTKSASTSDFLTHRIFGHAALTWRWPWIWQGQRTSHIIEPVAMAVVAPKVSSLTHKVPNEDSADTEWDGSDLFIANRMAGWDRLDGGQRIDYGLRYSINRQAIGDNTSDPGHISLFLGQSYQWQGVSILTRSQDKTRQLSDIVGQVDFAETVGPMRTSLSYRMRWDFSRSTLISSQLRSTFKADKSHLDLSYINIEAGATTPSSSSRHEIYAKGGYQLSKRWLAQASTRYQLDNGGQITNLSYGLTYRGDCIGWTVAYRRNYDRDRDYIPNASYTVDFVLKNLGTAWKEGFSKLLTL